MALAIGACTSAFRLIDALLLRPLPVAEPEQLSTLARHEIFFDGTPQTFDGWAYPAFQQMRAAVKDQAELIAISYAERTDLTTVFTKARRASGNYSFFAGQVENWFVDPSIMALDEYGVPVQIGQKLERWLQPEGDLDAVLLKLKNLEVERLPLTPFEKSLVADAKQYI